MNQVIVPMNAFPQEMLSEKGQQSLIPVIAQAGAYGAEIRRELFAKPPFPLASIRQELETHKLFAVYSAPIPVWEEDGSLNREGLAAVFQEAKEAGAGWVKTCLGHYSELRSGLPELKVFLESEPAVQLLVENDQTPHGGSIERLKAFFVRAQEHRIPVKMTFDIGNWRFSGEDLQRAIASLRAYTGYLHLKHVEAIDGRLVTLSLPEGNDQTWRQACASFPKVMARALEFPIESEQKLQTYIEMVQNQR